MSGNASRATKSALSLMSPAAEFRRIFENAFSRLPFRTPRGVVARLRREAQFGTPHGPHEPTRCWVYSAYESPFELLFAFYSNFSPDDLICKVVIAQQTMPKGEGASLQFNGNKSVVDDGVHFILRHDGRVTIRSPIRRDELLSRIREYAPQADIALGGIEFPFVCGTTADVGALLDRLFLYSYAIE